MSTRRTTRPNLAVVIAAVSLAFAGCATSYEVKVDAISQPAKVKEAVSYKIKTKTTAGTGVQDDGLREQEAANYIKTALSGKGMYEAPTIEAADMVVELDYGVEPPRVKFDQTSMPLYAQVGGGVRYEQVQVTDQRGNTANRTVAVYDPPRTELVGYQDVVTPVTVYEKYLNITARENKQAEEGKPPAEIWSVRLSNEDASKDLRKYLPILATASIDYIGKDSTTQKTVNIKESDPGITFIKKGM